MTWNWNFLTIKPHVATGFDCEGKFVLDRSRRKRRSYSNQCHIALPLASLIWAFHASLTSFTTVSGIGM